MSTAPSQEPQVLVHLPAELRARAHAQSTVGVASGEMHAIIAARDETYPGLRFNLCAETGELRPYINIFVNGRNIRLAANLETPVAAGSVIHIMRSVAGG